MKAPVHIFLGANSGEGFYSLYDQLLNARFDDLLVIKGGPGCGKSSFMRAVAKELAAAGHDPIYVNCSGDPDSLDAALFPALRVGLVDGTSPHESETQTHFLRKTSILCGLAGCENGVPSQILICEFETDRSGGPLTDGCFFCLVRENTYKLRQYSAVHNPASAHKMRL